MDLFDYSADEHTRQHRPLAERMRPAGLDGFVGQEQAVGPGSALRNAIEHDRLFSMILWGPPGCGKTTLARIIASETRSHYMAFSAVLSGVRDIRSVIDQARQQRQFHHRRTILFVDEIHRFNKAQQDAFLHHVESGLITLIGATTENPSFEVIPALLSRCRVITLDALSREEIRTVIDRAVADEENGLGQYRLHIDPAAADFLIDAADGDLRFALNGLEIAADMARTGEMGDTDDPAPAVDIDILERALQKKALLYDKAGESHYNLISAFHKSLRGSDPDASLYWLARMLVSGEDPFYIARRMVRFASEDVGNADPRALSVSLDAMEAFRFLGSPEGELALVQAAIYLATAPKSNSLYAAFNAVRLEIDRTGALPVPKHIRNAPTALMKSMGYGKGYRYAHDDPDGYVVQSYMPEELNGNRYYRPVDRGFEREIHKRLQYWQSLRNRKTTDPSEPKEGV